MHFHSCCIWYIFNCTTYRRDIPASEFADYLSRSKSKSWMDSAFST